METNTEEKETQAVDIDKKPNATSGSVKKAVLGRGNKFIRSRFFIVALLVILACSPAAYFYRKSRQAEKLLKDPNTANQQVINEVVKKVSRHILLPTDEQPTLASVTDVNKVKGQPFFANAQNGDKVLVYTQARKAFLYRPDRDIMIEVAPLNVGSLDASSSTGN